MLKKVLSIVLTMGLILSVLAVPAFAETTVAPIVIEAESYATIGNKTATRSTVGSGYAWTFSSGTPRKTVSAGELQLAKGDWVTYNVTIPESGAYTFTATARAHNANTGGLTVKESTSTMNNLGSVYVSGTTAQEWTIGSAYLEAGAQTLVFMNHYRDVFNGIVDVDKIQITKSSETLSKTTSIEAELYDRCDKGTQANNVYATGSTQNFKAVLNPTQWVEYDVYVAQAGFYKLGAEMSCTAGITISATCNNGESLTATVPTTGGVITPMELGLVELNAGNNVIRVSNPSNVINLDRLTLEKASLKTSIDVDLADTGAILNNAAVSEGTLTLEAGGSATYSISTDFYGSYAITGTGSCAVAVDGHAVSGDVAVIPDGEHTLTVSSESGATIRVINLSLIAQSTQVIAETYENAYDASDGDAIVPIEAHKVSFQPGDWVEYTINIPENGKYMISAYCAAPSGSRFKILTDEGTVQRLVGNVDVVESFSTPTLSSLGTITFEAGEYDLRFLNDSQGCYFINFAVTYVGEPEYNATLTVQEATSSYDASADGAALTIYQNKYFSMSTNDYVVFDVYAIRAGVYDFSISQASNHALYHEPTLAVVNEDNGYNLVGDVSDTGDLNTFVEDALGEIVLSKGVNTLKVFVTNSAAFHLESMSVNYSDATPVAAISKQAEDYNYGTGEGTDYHDITPDEDDEGNDYFSDGIEAEDLGNDNYAVLMEETEWFTYTVNASRAGYYNVKMLAKTDATAKTMKVYAGNQTITAVVTGLYPNGYVIYNLGDVYLNAGESILKVELEEGDNVLVDKLMLADADVSFTAESGTTSVSGNLRGLFEGKAVLCVLASYDIGNDNVRTLVDFDVVEISKGGVNDALELAVTSGDEAKLFIWDSANMLGSVYIN